MNKLNMLYIAVVFALGLMLIVLSSLVKQQQEDLEILKEGIGDFMMYMINVTTYCVELNNMTTDELFKGFLEQEADRIISEAFPENISFNISNIKDSLHTCFNASDLTWLESNCEEDVWINN